MKRQIRRLLFGDREIQARFSRTHLPWHIRWASYRFRVQRSDYYEYMASCLQSGARHRSLLDVLQIDATRHRAGSSRAVLASWWANRYLLCSASLSETYEGTLPASDVACLAMTQNAGQEAMAQVLESLAQRTATLEKCRQTFVHTTLAGLVAMLAALMVLTLLPIYTLPRLTQTFSAVPSDWYGASTQSLVRWVAHVQRYGWVILSLVLLWAGWLKWALHNWVGKVREYLDSSWGWRLIRDLQAIHFLSLTSTLVQTMGHRGASLRTILQLQLEFSCPWLRAHLLRMLIAMDLGAEPLDALNTGLLDEQSWGRLHDVVSGYGLTQGFAQAGARVMQLLVERLSRQAIVVRWILLLLSVTAVLWMGYWHARVIEEMRQAMLLGLAVG